MNKYDYLIVGSGLFGAVCAHELKKKGFRVLVVEKRNHVGGNVFTEEKEGIIVHKYGAHIFHTSNEEVWNYINQFASFNNFVNSPIAVYKNEKYNLPFNMNTFVKIWSDIKTPDDAKKKIEDEKKKYHVEVPKNLEEQAINLVGVTIYEKLIKGYSAKQWGKSCNELPPSIIKRIPVRFTFNNNYFNDIYQGIPIGGYTPIINKMLKDVEVKTNYDFFEHKEELMNISEHIIFTGPIDQFFKYKYGPLEYRSLHFKEEVLNIRQYQETAVTNYTEYDIPYTRIIEHKHFEINNKSPKTIISKEYPLKWEERIEPYYPINDEKNDNLYKLYLKEAENVQKVYFGGRLGHYKYYDMDQAILAALNYLKKLN